MLARIIQMVLKLASLIPDALEITVVIRHGHISAFPGHSVMFRGHICLDLWKRR